MCSVYPHTSTLTHMGANPILLDMTKPRPTAVEGTILVHLQLESATACTCTCPFLLEGIHLCQPSPTVSAKPCTPISGVRSRMSPHQYHPASGCPSLPHSSRVQNTHTPTLLLCHCSGLTQQNGTQQFPEEVECTTLAHLHPAFVPVCHCTGPILHNGATLAQQYSSATHSHTYS